MNRNSDGTTKATIAKNITCPTKMKMLSAPADKYAVWQKRLRIDDIFMELAIEDFETNVMEVYNLMVAHCKSTYTLPQNVSWQIVDNVLLADGKSLGRVGPTHKRFGYDPKADYWYDKIMARQSRYMPD